MIHAKCLSIPTLGKLILMMMMMLEYFFYLPQQHCNLSEDIQQSCLTVTINGM